MNDAAPRPPAHAAGTLRIGDRTVHRLGFGAMQLTGPGAWGPPLDPAAARRVLQRSVELGIDLIDTANSYGPEVSEELIREALHPYPPHLVITTKAGLERSGPDEWRTDCRPERLQAHCEASLRRLGLDRIPLFQLHRVDPAVPFAEQLGALVDLREQGKIEHIGLSEVSVAQIGAARAITPIASVQNRYNLVDRGHDPVLDHCEREGIVFIPWVPLGSGSLVRADGPLAGVASSLRVSPSQLALAWLLQRSPVMLPIPGTSSVAHLEQNVRAAEVRLIDADVEAIEDLTGGNALGKGLRKVKGLLRRSR